MRPADPGIGSPLYHIIPHLASSREAYLKLIRTFASLTGDRQSVNSGNDPLDGPLIMYFEKQLSQVCLINFFNIIFWKSPHHCVVAGVLESFAQGYDYMVHIIPWEGFLGLSMVFKTNLIQLFHGNNIT